MGERPGTAVAQRPLHFFVLADCSGSMAADGKMQALNTAMRETIPHLLDVARQNPHARLMMRVLAFSTGARWHVGEAVNVEDFTWDDLEAGGYTDLGAALTELAAQLTSPPMEERAVPPAIILVSDGLPTDDWRGGLDRLVAQPWGQRSIRMAIGIGRDADQEVLRAFSGRPDSAPLNASNPEQLVRLIRWASTHAGRVASTLAPDRQDAPVLLVPAASEIVW